MAELNMLEREFCSAIDWRLIVSTLYFPYSLVLGFFPSRPPCFSRTKGSFHEGNDDLTFASVKNAS